MEKGYPNAYPEEKEREVDDEPDTRNIPGQRDTKRRESWANIIDKEFYPMQYNRGQLIIICNNNDGCEDFQKHDIQLLHQLAESLDTNATLLENLKREDILDQLEKFSLEESRCKEDYLIVVILAEDKGLNRIYENTNSKEKQSYSLKDVFDKLISTEITRGSGLNGKPKLIFVQSYTLGQTDTPGEDKPKSSGGKIKYLPRMADFFVSYNSINDIYIDDEKFPYTSYIYYLCKTLMESIKQGKGLVKTMTKVHGKVATYNKQKNGGTTKIPRSHSMLRYDVKFNYHTPDEPSY